MPVDSVRLTLKPAHFFDGNPALDVPESKDKHSALAFEANGTSINGNGCCA